MKIVLGTIEGGKLCSRVLVPDRMTRSLDIILTEAARQADMLFSPGKWHIHNQESLLFGGYIVSDNPDSEGDTITIQ